MDPEKRFLVVAEDLPVKFLIFLVGAGGGGLQPERFGVVDGLRGFRFLNGLRAVLILHGLRFFGLLVRVGEIDRVRHERAVFFQHFAGAPFIGELQRVFGEVQRDRGAALRAVTGFQAEIHAAFGFPVNGLGTFLPGEGIDGDLVGDHEGRVEAQAEVADDLVLGGLVLIGVQKVRSAGKGDVVDVFLYFLSGHAEAVVLKAEDLIRRIGGHVNAQFFLGIQSRFTHQFQFFQFGDGVAAVRDHLAEKDIVVGIEPLFDDRKHVFRVHGKVAVFSIHKEAFFLLNSVPDYSAAAKKCQEKIALNRKEC